MLEGSPVIQYLALGVRDRGMWAWSMIDKEVIGGMDLVWAHKQLDYLLEEVRWPWAGWALQGQQGPEISKHQKIQKIRNVLIERSSGDTHLQWRGI